MEKQESEEERAELVRKILTPERRPTRDRWRDQHSPKVENERELAEKVAKLVEKVAELNAARWEKFENEIKEKLSLWLADTNEPIHKQVDSLQERITKLEALVQGHPHDVQES